MLGSYSCIHTTIERLNKLEFFSDRNGLKNGQHGETAKAPRLVQWGVHFAGGSSACGAGCGAGDVGTQWGALRAGRSWKLWKLWWIQKTCSIWFFFLGNLWWILRKPMFHWFWSDWLFDLVCLLSKNRFDERSNIHDIKNNTRISPTGIIHFTRNCDEDRTKQIMVWVKICFFFRPLLGRSAI